MQAAADPWADGARVTWLALRGVGVRYVVHLISEWRSRPGQELRFESLCGRVDTDQVVVEDGELVCVACLTIEAREDDEVTERR